LVVALLSLMLLMLLLLTYLLLLLPSLPLKVMMLHLLLVLLALLMMLRCPLLKPVVSSLVPLPPLHLLPPLTSVLAPRLMLVMVTLNAAALKMLLLGLDGRSTRSR
jgi:hypothetical protein